MKKLLKLVFLLVLVVGVAGVVAAIVSRKKFESMSDDEIRSFLAEKLDGKVDEAQLASIQDAVVAGVRARKPSDHYVEEVQDAVHELGDVAEEAAQELQEAAGDVADAAGDAATAVVDED
jgi:predicted Ser/Thr protein kinase